MRFFHGGKSGLMRGDKVIVAPPHVEDGCPICEARKRGMACTVGAYRAWLRLFGAKADPVLVQLTGVTDDAPMDPPSSRAAVYITSSIEYATWYAARSRRDLYEVRPVGPIDPSPEDHFQSWACAEAIVVRALRRSVVLLRTERRQIMHKWRKADRRADRAHQLAEVRA